MFELLPVNDKHVLAFKAKGKLTNEDYIQFLPELEKLIREEGRISLYVELEDFQGWEAKAAWDDLHFGLQHDRDFRRIAIIGDNTLEHVGVALANFFSNTEMRFFNRENSKDAWEWLKEIPEHKKQAEPLQPYRRLLLATDFSRYSEQAAHRAMELSRQYDAELQVLHIVEAEIFYTDYNDPIIPDALLQDGSFKDFAENNMASFAEKTGLPSGTPYVSTCYQTLPIWDNIDLGYKAG